MKNSHLYNKAYRFVRAGNGSTARCEVEPINVGGNTSVVADNNDGVSFDAVELAFIKEIALNRALADHDMLRRFQQPLPIAMCRADLSVANRVLEKLRRGKV